MSVCSPINLTRAGAEKASPPARSAAGDSAALPWLLAAFKTPILLIDLKAETFCSAIEALQFWEIFDVSAAVRGEDQVHADFSAKTRSTIQCVGTRWNGYSLIFKQ
jgi:hypothetical protein